MTTELNAILARLRAQGMSRVGSLPELVAWCFEDPERLRLVARRDAGALAQAVGLPKDLALRILYHPPFLSAVYDELHLRVFGPDRLEEVYRVVMDQLKDPEVPLGAKRSILELVFRQTGLEKPRKLSVKQQSEVVVRVEQVRPEELFDAQVLEALGVGVVGDGVEARALPEEASGARLGGEVRAADADRPEPAWERLGERGVVQGDEEEVE